jgi:hypothetical protein
MMVTMRRRTMMHAVMDRPVVNRVMYGTRHRGRRRQHAKSNQTGKA